MAQEMIFAQDWSAVDAKNYTERKDPIHGTVTIFHDVVIAREIVQPYEIDGKMLMAYKSADELEQYWPWVDGRWAIAGRHPDTPVIVSPGDIAGRTVNPRFVKNLIDHAKTGRNNIRGILVDLEVFNDRVAPDLLKGMKDGSLPSVSIGFLYAKEFISGNWNGSDYDLRQINMFHDHLAFGIRKGRCAYPACGIGADSLLAAKCLNDGCSDRQVKDMVSITVGHDPEETEENILIDNPGVGDCDVTATISISEEEGIQARYCGKISEVRTFLFSKAKGWTMEKAQAWVDEHKEGAGDALYKRLFAMTAIDQEEETQEPKSDEERAMAHFEISPEVWASLPDKAKSALIAALPEEETGADAMTEEELKAKIEEVQKKIDELYTPVPETETEKHAEYEILYAELKAYTDALAEMIKAKVTEEPVSGVDEVERSKRLLSDPRLRRDLVATR